jgi:hypothetical protein
MSQFRHSSCRCLVRVPQNLGTFWASRRTAGHLDGIGNSLALCKVAAFLRSRSSDSGPDTDFSDLEFRRGVTKGVHLCHEGQEHEWALVHHPLGYIRRGYGIVLANFIQDRIHGTCPDRALARVQPELYMQGYLARIVSNSTLTE